MAEILYSLAASLLMNLGSTAVDTIASAQSFKTDLGKLENTINTIKDVLLDAEQRQFENHTVRRWLDRLTTVMYDADDLFDEFATVIAQREAVGKVHTLLSGSSHVGFAFNISRKIKKIQKQLADIVKDSSQFAFVLRPLEEGRLTTRGRDQTCSFVDVEEVIGRENDRDVIINALMGSCAAQEQRLSVVSIVGIGGLGKTTLAQLVYNDERIKKRFDLRLWVCASEDFDLREVSRKILMSATNTESKNLELDQLQRQLRKEISERKYLLVLDDVWNEKPEEWLKLSAILKVGGEGSMILVTTRSRKVADIMGTVPSYDLGGLLEEKSWSLFEKMAFEPGESLKKPQLVELGKKIVKKCANVPLALRTLGSLLRGSEEGKWISVEDISFANLPDGQTHIMAILKLSYHHLLSPLKSCFAYCALFPKDYKFGKEYLIDLWMAEGFVNPEYESQSLNVLAGEYLKILLQRCFFQDVTRDAFGNISTFKMHDLMHDLAQDICRSDTKVMKLHDRNFTNRIRRLSFDHQVTNSWRIPSCLSTAKQLRTFVLPQQFLDGTEFNSAVLKQLISSFKCLRVLDLRKLGLRTLPKSIGKLLHLRYLNLSENPIKTLPNSITTLQNLQTLILESCRSLIELPIQTRNLTNLRTLNLFDCPCLTHIPPGLGELTSLHKLPYFVVMWNPVNALLSDLKNLNNLSGSLQIKVKGELEDPASEAQEANLITKHGLTELHVYYPSYPGRNSGKHDEVVLEGLKPHLNLKKFEIYNYKGEKLPSWAMGDSLCTTLPNLVEIRLFKCFECMQVPCFSQLPFLKRLFLYNLRKVEYMEKSLQHEGESPQSPSTRTFFPSLQELQLSGMCNLKGWWEETKVVDKSDGETILQPSTQCYHGSPSFSGQTISIFNFIKNLKGWWEERKRVDCNDAETVLQPSFSGLIQLEIENCPGLTSLPVCPNVEQLTMKGVKKELPVLKKLTNSDIGSSKLKSLEIDDVEVLRSMPVECLGQLTSLEIVASVLKNTSELEKVFRHLSSLTSLKFSRCDHLTSISVGMEHLVSLETLTLEWCWKLEIIEKGEVEAGMPWKALTSLRTLHFNFLNKVKHLPSGLQHLTNLRHLQFVCNSNLKEVPEWIGSFSSLQSMRITNCPKLRCLPEEVRKLTSLNQLSIIRCDGLTKRCRGPHGADWPYIRHIPFLAVYD